MRRLATCLIAFLLITGCAQPGAPRQSSAPEPSGAGGPGPVAGLAALRGDSFALVAPQNGRRYDIHVRLPDGYDPAAAIRYPIVYLLDGDSLFPLLAPTHLFLTYDEGLPEAILVGIAYGGFEPGINRRGLDFSAPAADASPQQGGAPEFHAFLKQTLIPRVEGRYRADGSRRILLGQSRGGYFVLWSALEDPDLFWGRIASNPVLDPGRDRFYRAAESHERGGLHVAVASGTRDAEALRDDARDWTQAWTDRPDAPWAVRLLSIQDGVHAASIGESYRQAMLWLFRDESGDTP